MTIQWIINRLIVMSPKEIFFRILRTIYSKIESLRLHFGWSPKTKSNCEWKIGTYGLFTDIGTSKMHSVILDENELHLLKEFMNGKWSVFGYQNLSIGQPINWHLEPLSGISTPTSFGKSIDYRNGQKVGEIKVLWEMGRHQFLVPFAIAYYKTKDSKYKEFIAETIDYWIQKNPYGYGLHWCSSLEVSLRAISWIICDNILRLAGEEYGLNGLLPNMRSFNNCLFQHANFIRNYLSRFSSANNHLIGEATGLFALCSTYDFGQMGQRWSDYSKAILEREQKLQVFEDGGNKEQAIYYHTWVLEYFILCMSLAEASNNAFSMIFVNRTVKMFDFLRDISSISGVPPQIGDSDDGSVLKFTVSDIRENVYRNILNILNTKTKISKDSKILLGDKSYWYNNMLAKSDLLDSFEHCVESKPFSIYDESGYALLRSEGLNCLFDFGSLGYTTIAAHGHSDALNVCISYDNEWWIIDPGTYAYHSNHQWRNYFRSTLAHNTIEINGKNQSRSGGPFLWVKHARAKLNQVNIDEKAVSVIASHEGYSSEDILFIRREIIMKNEGELFKISDSVNSKRLINIKLPFHLHPDVKVDSSDNEKFLLTRKGTEKSIEVKCDPKCNWFLIKGSTDPIMGWYSDKLGSKIPSNTIIGELNTIGPANLITEFKVLKVC